MGAAPTCPVLVGPTAVGKTGLVTRLAAAHPIEVISLDSRQIYRGLRIGTAQPTSDELALCRHHLIDFVSPDRKYDAMRFRRDFERVHREIAARGGRPILVGGAGLYLTALRAGFLDLPGHDAEHLAAVRSELGKLDERALHERLEAVDPDSAARLHRNDRYRRQRALEIHELTGRTMTDLIAAQRPHPALGLDFRVFVLERPVAELDARISARTGLMLERGWIRETEAALAAHRADGPGLGSIGYRQIVDHLQGRIARADLDAAIVRVTRQYAKRQRTWFRRVEAEWRGRPDAPGLPGVLSALFS